MKQNSLYFLGKQDLEMAIQNQEFCAVYQPQIDLSSGKITGMETLIRWIHPIWGAISPAEFIPLAEDYGVIDDITKWVLKKACEQNKCWQDRGLPKVKVSVNISPVDFEAEELYEMVVNTLKDTGLNPKYLELEITETAIIKDVEKTIEILNRLKNSGVSIAVDDFGTGNSSLAYLRDLPISKVKIDRSFMKNIPYNKKKSSIVKNIIHMCHNLNLQIVAEGVETEEEVIFLSLHNCTIAQGFLFSKPMFAEDFERNFLDCEENAISLIYRLEDRVNLGTAQKNDHRFKSLFNQNPDLVCSVGLNRRVLSVNPAIEKLLGYKSQEVLNKDILSYIHSEDTNLVENSLNKLMKGQTVDPIDIRLNHKDKCLVPCNVTSFPMRLGDRIVGVYSVIKDMSKQKKLEEALSESERKYRLLTENMSDLLSLVDVNGVIQYASPSHNTMLGLDPDQLEGMSIFNDILSKNIEKAKEEYEKIIQNKQPRFLEIQAKSQEGNPIWIEVHGTPVLNTDNSISHVVLVSRDITKRKIDELGQKNLLEK